jgi:hypothetical protein
MTAKLDAKFSVSFPGTALAGTTAKVADKIEARSERVKNRAKNFIDLLQMVGRRLLRRVLDWKVGIQELALFY